MEVEPKHDDEIITERQWFMRISTKRYEVRHIFWVQGFTRVYDTKDGNIYDIIAENKGGNLLRVRKVE